MVSSLLENILTRTDTLLERFFHPPENEQTVSFRQYLTAPRKILLIPGENLADLVLSLGFVLPLLKKFPQVEIFMLVPPEQACLIKNIPRLRPVECDHRSSYTFDGVFRKTASKLRLEKFDWSVNLTYSGRPEALLTYYSGAVIRTGLSNCENDKYYNLIVRNIPEQASFVKRFGALFRALQIEGPFDSISTFIKPDDTERLRAEHFLRRRKSSRNQGKFTGCAFEWRPGQKKVERYLHNFIEGLIVQIDPLHLLIAGNLVPPDDLRKWTNITAYTYNFNDLKQMIAVLSLCDKVVTNSTGLACVLGRLGTRVSLLETDTEYISRLDRKDLANIQIFKSDNNDTTLKQALKFTQ